MFRTALVIGVVLGVGILGAAYHQAPSIAAGGLLHPGRRTTLPPRPARCTDTEFTGAGITLRGWTCEPEAKRRGTVVYLHGIADNRGSSVGAIDRFTRQGFAVVAYDSRAHGASGGDVCTYGYLEKGDLARIIGTLPAGPVILLGTSLGAAVALQTAAEDSRVSAVVAAETFSDLDTIARERAPFFLTEGIIRKALLVAEKRGAFRIADVSPVHAAGKIRVPVLLVHGAADTETPPAHSERVHAALVVPKRLLLVPEAGHNESLQNGATWVEIESWLMALRQSPPPPLN